MRALVPALALALVLAQPARAQSPFVGRWDVRNQQGGTTSLVLTTTGPGALGGTFSGNGNSFAVTGTVTGDEAAGTIAGRGMTLFFQAQVKGGTLLLVLAEPGAGGTPNLGTAQQIIMTKAAAGEAPAAAAPRSSAPSPSASTGTSDLDRRMIALLTANAWCAFSFSGSQSYSSSSGTSRTERVVLARDGTATSNQRRESSTSSSAGSVASQGDGSTAGRWRFENGVLAFSEDGQSWQNAAFKMTFNSNGSPIPVVNGKEYMVCQ